MPNISQNAGKLELSMTGGDHGEPAYVRLATKNSYGTSYVELGGVEALYDLQYIVHRLIMQLPKDAR